MLEEEADAPATLAALLYQQLEAREAKQADLLQSSKCLVFLAPQLYEMSEREGLLPSQQVLDKDRAEEGEC